MDNKINCTLIIDDDAISNYITLGVFKKLKWSKHIKCVSSAEEAFEFIENFARINGCCPELIIVDIKMPRINGFEFMHRLMTMNFKNIDKVIVVGLSANNLPSHIQVSPFHETFKKPFKAEQAKYLLETYFEDGERVCA